MAVTLTPDGGDPVGVVVWRDDAQGYDATATVYWPLGAADPVIGLGPVRAPAGTLTVVYDGAVWDVLASGQLVTLDTDCERVPSRVFAVTRLTVAHDADDPASTRLIRAEVQAVGMP